MLTVVPESVPYNDHLMCLYVCVFVCKCAYLSVGVLAGWVGEGCYVHDAISFIMM